MGSGRIEDPRLARCRRALSGHRNEQDSGALFRPGAGRCRGTGSGDWRGAIVKLFGWTSMFDLRVQQTDADPYAGPCLRLSPLSSGQVEFRFVDTRTVRARYQRAPVRGYLECRSAARTTSAFSVCALSGMTDIDDGPIPAPDCGPTGKSVARRRVDISLSDFRRSRSD